MHLNMQRAGNFVAKLLSTLYNCLPCGVRHAPGKPCTAYAVYVSFTQ
jgi:hypothetical protein